MKKKQKGFSIVEVLIIFAVVGLIAVSGWFVWRSHQRTKLDSSNEHINANAEKIVPLNTTSWAMFESKLYGINIKIPNGWKAEDLSLEDPYPGVIISSPTVTLDRESEEGNSSGVFSILIRTSKPVSQNNDFIKTNQVGNLGKCQELSSISLGSVNYKLVETAYNLNHTPEDPYAGEPYNNKYLFDHLNISSGCIASNSSDSGNTLAPNIKVAGSELILTASAAIDTAEVNHRGNSSTTIPFTIEELHSNKYLETFVTILTSIKEN